MQGQANRGERIHETAGHFCSWQSTRRDAQHTMRIDYVLSHWQSRRRRAVQRSTRSSSKSCRFPVTRTQPVRYETLRGKYLFEIVDPDTGDVLVFAQLQRASTVSGRQPAKPAASIARFHESVRFPRHRTTPVRARRSSKRARGAMHFGEVWRLPVDPNRRPSYTASLQPTRMRSSSIHESGDPAMKVDLLLLGDGYTAERARCAFLDRARELTAILVSRRRRSRSARTISMSGRWPHAAAQSGHLPSIDRRTYRDSPAGHNAYDAVSAPNATY